MKIFRLRADSDHYEFLSLVDDSNWRVLNAISDGIRSLDDWRPFPVKRVKQLNKKKLLNSDFPGFGPWDVFSEHAVSRLSPSLTSRGNLLPLQCAEGNYFAYQPTLIVDALDEEKSQLRRLADGTLIDIRVHCFKPGAASEATIFRLPQKPWGPTYVTEEFAAAVSVARLVGFHFELVGES